MRKLETFHCSRTMWLYNEEIRDISLQPHDVAVSELTDLHTQSACATFSNNVAAIDKFDRMVN